MADYVSSLALPSVLRAAVLSAGLIHFLAFQTFARLGFAARAALCLLAIAVVLVPVGDYPLATWLSPVSDLLSPFGIVLILASLAYGERWLMPRLPAFAGVVFGVLLTAGLFFPSWPDFLVSGYHGEALDLPGVILTALLAVMLAGLAYATPLFGLASLIPAALWFLGIGGPNLWMGYTDVIVLAVLLPQLVTYRHFAAAFPAKRAGSLP